MTLDKKTAIVQFIKYAMVGVLNTLVTLAVIFVCKSVLNWDLYLSNALGYIAGVINSFIWNKMWVFRSHNGVMREAAKFIVGFGLCYLLQLLAVYALTEWSWLGQKQWEVCGFVIGGYGVATLIGNIVYTLANFIYNRLVTFK